MRKTMMNEEWRGDRIIYWGIFWGGGIKMGVIPRTFFWGTVIMKLRTRKCWSIKTNRCVGLEESGISNYHLSWLAVFWFKIDQIQAPGLCCLWCLGGLMTGENGLYDWQQESMDWILTVAFIELLREIHGLKAMGAFNRSWTLGVKVLHNNIIIATIVIIWPWILNINEHDKMDID